MSAVDIIRKLQATNSRTDKEQILYDAWLGGERNFFTGMTLAYDALISFGVKKAATIEGDDPTFVGTTTFQDFLDLADKLRRRQLTGNAARDALTDFASRTDSDMWNTFYRQIILKDLRCGTTDTTVNKVLGKLAKSDPTAHQYLVPIFECALAKDGMDPANANKIRGKKMLDIKLDGVRLLTVVDKEEGTVTQYTRNGKVNTNFPHIRAVFEQMMESLEESTVYDGEIVSGSFQELMTQINRKSEKDSGGAKLALFDVIPLAEFKAGKSKLRQRERHTKLCGDIQVFLKLASAGEVYVVPKLTVDLDTPEGKQAFKEFNREAIEAKFEGIMVKDPEAFYECKRSFAWLKIKPFIEVSLTITGYEEGEGKYVGMLGAWIMEGVDDGKQIKVKVAGFVDKDRDEFWKLRDHYVGFIGEVRGDCLTLKDGETVYSMRFPRWKGFRGTVKGEKL